jgi:hypothetical protein
MRIAAGVLMIILAMALTYIVYLGGEGVMDIRTFDLWFSLFIIISGVFLVTGGVSCLRRRYWKLCFTAALFAIFVMILWLGLFGESLFFPGGPPRLYLAHLVFIAGGILPIIFVRLRKREWRES